MRGMSMMVALLVTGLEGVLATPVCRGESTPTPTPTPSASPSPATPALAGIRTAVPSPYEQLDVLSMGPEEKEALLAAGFDIQKGRVPSKTLTSQQLATFREIERTLTAHVCPPKGTPETCERFRVDVPRCIDRAGEIIAWRRRERDRVDRKLYIAAMGVSVTGREFPTYVNLVRFCRDMIALDPAHRPSPTPQQ